MIPRVIGRGVIALALCVAGVAQSRPNVVVILADDLGAGDPRCYNPESKVPTPGFDRLAREGMRFTDAHSPSSVCTPTRYGIATGRYAWRTRLKRWTFDGYGRALIEPGETTLASWLGERGYATAAFGKWHLGLGAFDAAQPDRATDYDVARFDAGPHTVGFARSRVIPASLDFAPYVWVTDGALEQAPTAVTPGGRRRWDGGPGFWRAGPIAPDFRIDRVLQETTHDAVEFVRSRAGERAPFFLYVPFSAPHTPWVPDAEFQGRSGAGYYGDFVAQVDASVGAIVDALDAIGVADSTLLVVTSDNGSHWRPADVARFGHDAHLGRRGMKADIHEAGHRVPLIVRWPGHVAPDTTSDALVGLVDLFATVADALGAAAPDGAAPDSVSILPVLEGRSATARDELVHHSGDGMFALRSGRWKLVDGLGSGGFTAPRRVEPTDDGPRGQLYDLAADPAESTDRWADEPDVVARLLRRLAAIRG